MTEKLRKDIASELIEIVSRKNTPDIIAIDCELKNRCASPERPWPFESAYDAALYFQSILDDDRRKYAGVSVIADIERNLLALRKDRRLSSRNFDYALPNP